MPDNQNPSQPGPGRPLFTSVVFPRLDEKGNVIESKLLALLGAKPGEALFEISTFHPGNNPQALPGKLSVFGIPLLKSEIVPFADADGKLEGGEGGTISALGGKAGEPLFEVLTFDFIPPDEREKKA